MKYTRLFLYHLQMAFIVAVGFFCLGLLQTYFADDALASQYLWELDDKWRDKDIKIPKKYQLCEDCEYEDQDVLHYSKYDSADETPIIHEIMIEDILTEDDLINAAIHVAERLAFVPEDDVEDVAKFLLSVAVVNTGAGFHANANYMKMKSIRGITGYNFTLMRRVDGWVSEYRPDLAWQMRSSFVDNTLGDCVSMDFLLIALKAFIVCPDFPDKVDDLDFCAQLYEATMGVKGMTAEFYLQELEHFADNGPRSEFEQRDLIARMEVSDN